MPVEDAEHVAQVGFVMLLRRRRFDRRAYGPVPELLRQGGEGPGAVKQPLIDFGPRRPIARIEFSGFFPEIFEDRAGLADRDLGAAGPVMIDDGRDLVAGADLHEVRLHLRFLAYIDRDDCVWQAGLLQHHARLVAVVGDPGVAIDHVISSRKNFACHFGPGSAVTAAASAPMNSSRLSWPSSSSASSSAFFISAISPRPRNTRPE